MKFFEDLRIGERQELGSHTFTAESIKAFARRYDPQLFHIDEEAAARSWSDILGVARSYGLSAYDAA